MKNKNAKHTATPGPWMMVKYPGDKCYTVRTSEAYRAESGEGPIGHIPIAEICADGQPDEANARLIAAAPELLAALENVYVLLDTFALVDPYNCKGTAQNAKIAIASAIAKAEGR